MRKIVISTAFVLALSGCATTGQMGGQYGSFVQPAAGHSEVVTDAVTQLVELFPPASTGLALQQPAPDPFGVALIKALRSNGYAVAEFVPAVAATGNGDKAKPAKPSGKPFQYVLDSVGAPGLYRLSLYVGTESITRPYAERAGRFVPAGAWVRLGAAQ